MSNGQPQKPNVTRGRIEAVPCPHCGHRADLRGIRDLGGGVGRGMGLLEKGNTISCDKCGRVMVVAAVATTTIVTVAQTNGRRPPDAQQPAPQPRRVVPGQAMQRRR